MSLIKLANLSTPGYPINVYNINVSNSKDKSSLNKKDWIALGTGATTGFAANELIRKALSKNNAYKNTLAGRYASRIGTVAGGALGTIAAYKMLKGRVNGSEQSPVYN